ncbi:hypothetical protein H3V53_26150 [Paraburkholderia bengalensis]|uniref:Uncharacterized protein n=1 Tax=Paraburkholderia bengalensis TaxID=2747562 RepID=A0ABU8IZ55_9BURK
MQIFVDAGSLDSHRRAAPVIRSRSVRSRAAPLRRFLALPVRARAHVAGDIAAQVAARRRRREILIACFRLLPSLEGRRLLRPPVPALRALLRKGSCGKQRNDRAADTQ